MLRAAGPLLTEADLPAEAETATGTATTATASAPLITLADLEAHHIQAVLRHCAGNKSVAAGILGIGRNTLYAKLKELRLE